MPIPEDDAAVIVAAPRAAAVPVVFDSPHSGSRYPDDFRPAAPPDLLRRAEDMYVEQLYADVPEFGATLIAARFPRVYIDPNRALADLDPELLAEPWPEPLEPGAKTRLGKGLIWRLCRPGVPVYDRKLTVAEVRRRIDHCWRPYHQMVRAALSGLHRGHGRVWYLDCHSMPSRSDELSPEGPGRDRPDFVLGDRDGTTCAPEFTAFVRDTLTAMGYRVQVNDPFKGVELLRAYSDPAAGRHGLQIEVNRRLYMDETTFVRGPGFDRLRADLRRLAQAICARALVR